jgi:hypothetical protein
MPLPASCTPDLLEAESPINAPDGVELRIQDSRKDEVTARLELGGGVTRVAEGGRR